MPIQSGLEPLLACDLDLYLYQNHHVISHSLHHWNIGLLVEFLDLLHLVVTAHEDA